MVISAGDLRLLEKEIDPRANATVQWFDKGLEVRVSIIHPNFGKRFSFSRLYSPDEMSKILAPRDVRNKLDTLSAEIREAFASFVREAQEHAIALRKRRAY